MSIQKVGSSSFTLEMLQLCFVAERAAPTERAVEEVEEKEQKTPDEFEIRRKQFFQP